MCRSDTEETKTQQKRAFPPLPYGFSSALFFPTPSPPPSPLLPLCFDFLFWLLKLTLFNFSHRRASHLRSGVKLASAFVRFAFLWICIFSIVRIKTTICVVTTQRKPNPIKSGICLYPQSVMADSFYQHRPKDILYKIQNNMTLKNSRGFCPTSGGKFEKRAWQNDFYMLW